MALIFANYRLLLFVEGHCAVTWHAVHSEPTYISSSPAACVGEGRARNVVIAFMIQVIDSLGH